MVFIPSLIPSTYGYDVIFACVDELCKSMAITTNVTIEKMTKLFCNHVYKLHGLFKVILSNTNPKFTKSFGMCCIVF